MLRMLHSCSCRVSRDANTHRWIVNGARLGYQGSAETVGERDRNNGLRHHIAIAQREKHPRVEEINAEAAIEGDDGGGMAPPRIGNIWAAANVLYCSRYLLQ